MGSNSRVIIVLLVSLCLCGQPQQEHPPFFDQHLSLPDTRAAQQVTDQQARLIGLIMTVNLLLLFIE